MLHIDEIACIVYNDKTCWPIASKNLYSRNMHEKYPTTINIEEKVDQCMWFFPINETLYRSNHVNSWSRIVHRKFWSEYKCKYWDIYTKHGGYISKYPVFHNKLTDNFRKCSNNNRKHWKHFSKYAIYSSKYFRKYWQYHAR